MGLRFRQSIKILPGLRINFGLRGISATVGPRGATVNFGPSGTHLNLGLPGTGLSYRTRLDRPESVPRQTAPPEPRWYAEPDVQDRPLTTGLMDVIQFQSVDAASLGSGSLERVSNLVEKLQRQRKTVEGQITEAEREAFRAERRAKRLAWLSRWIAPATVAARREYAEECSGRLDVLREIKESLVLNVEFGISEESKQAFIAVANAFDGVSRCTRIWDITSAQGVDRYRTRSAASQLLDMRLVRLGRSDDSVLTTEFKPPHFKNANGADLLLYPAFVAARVADRFALLDIRKIQITTSSTRFIVYDGDVPSDAQIVGNTWQYVNKDGNADRRFSNNPTIPMVQYGQIFFGGEGLNEAWMVSNADAGIAFGEAVRQYKESLTDSETEVDGIAPPTADEWPELNLPEKLTPPPLDWQTPVSFYLGLTVIAYLLIVGLKSPLSAVADFTNFLQTQRSIATPEEENSAAARMSPDALTQSPLTATEIAEMQRLLRTAGFDPGSADGKAGARTQKALSGWASKRDLPNAKLNRGTLELMRQEEPTRRVNKLHRVDVPR